MSLAGWRRVTIENGVMLLPPDPGTGVIQLRHRQPLRSFADLVAHTTNVAIGGQAMKLIAPPRAITTDEGEYGAIVQLGSDKVRRSVGVVYGDEAMSTVDGRTAAADKFELYAEMVDKLTQSLALGLGTDRWRRFRYQPPKGWDGFARFRSDVWLAPGFPKAYGAITVFHARPENESRVLVQHHKLFEELTIEFGARRGEPRPMQTRSGLVGQAVQYEATFGGEIRNAANAVFADGRYMYLVRIDTDQAHRDRHTDAFLELAASIESVPWPRQDLAGLIHWSE